MPEEIVDDVCYPSKEYGLIPQETEEPLSTTLAALRETPTKYPYLQARILAQSLLVPDHRIKVIPHGYADYFTVTPETLVRPKEMSNSDWDRLREIVANKMSLLTEMRNLVTKMIIFSGPHADK